MSFGETVDMSGKLAERARQTAWKITRQGSKPTQAAINEIQAALEQTVRECADAAGDKLRGNPQEAAYMKKRVLRAFDLEDK